MEIYQIFYYDNYNEDSTPYCVGFVMGYDIVYELLEADECYFYKKICYNQVMKDKNNYCESSSDNPFEAYRYTKNKLIKFLMDFDSSIPVNSDFDESWNGRRLNEVIDSIRNLNRPLYYLDIHWSCGEGGSKMDAERIYLSRPCLREV